MNAKKTGREYWRSLDDLADSPQFRELMSKEFADYAPEMITSPTRRGVMKVMAASMAMAGLAGIGGCRRWPERTLAPYNDRPEGRIPGIPEQFATAYDVGGYAQPILVSSFDGRPIKVEGNPSHPASNGAATHYAQASVLSMYDPHRSQKPLGPTTPKALSERPSQTTATWAAFEDAIKAAGTDGLAVLSEASSSVTLTGLKAALITKGAAWYTYEPINCDNEIAGSKLAFGEAARGHLHIDKASVIVCLDADPLGAHPDALRNARNWAVGRRSADTDKKMNRMFSVESRYSITGSNADRRLALASSKIGQVARAIAGLSANLDAPATKFAAEIKKAIEAAGSSAVVIVGANQPAEVHALGLLINQQIKAIGTTITFSEEPNTGDNAAQIKALAADMTAGKVKTLVILGGNPVYNAPADVNFAEALKKVSLSAHLSSYVDETSKACTWHLPKSHYLEAWNDSRSFDGTITVVQPLILPLYESRSDIEVAAILAGQKQGGLQLVQAALKTTLPSDTFGKSWRKVLFAGLVEGSGYKPVTPKVDADAVAKLELKAASDLEVVLTHSYGMYDGRFATNGWLHELPDPMTKLVWDNAAMVAPATAAKLNLKHNDVIKITVGERSVAAAVYLMPGQAVDSIALALGYGRTDAGDVGNDIGFNVYPLLTTGAMTIVTGVTVSTDHRRYDLVTTQEHHMIDTLGMAERGRRVGKIVREGTLAEYAETKAGAVPEFIEAGDTEKPMAPSHDGKSKVPLQIWSDPLKYDAGFQWAMAIDLNSCIGCGACTIACQAENNIPIVGKEQVQRGREMHWIRIDRYFKVRDASGKLDPTSDLKDPNMQIEAVHQPMTCHHCENAPCESVCPVAATTHDTEGLNVMVYNRCVGTRYCSNNCPYKVRRFNYFDWNFKDPRKGPSDGMYLGIPDEQQNARITPIQKMGFNPDVTVRMRGVMEKCTFCTQRIKAVTIPLRNDFRRKLAAGDTTAKLELADGKITPACAQTCPTQAITFGNLMDPNSRVSKIQGRTAGPQDKFKADPSSVRAYEVLAELNTRPRVRYLARITNGGVEAPAAPAHESEHHG